jgi:diguanylate cyclase (GGDEF)-like protein
MGLLRCGCSCSVRPQEKERLDRRAHPNRLAETAVAVAAPPRHDLSMALRLAHPPGCLGGDPTPVPLPPAIIFAASALVVYLAVRMNCLETMALATSDALTGLANRRGFAAIVELEIARQKRHGGVFSLAMPDLDDFKELNDSRGHAAGDQALTLAADVLRNSARHSDSIARLGGDEFSILLPNARQADCRPFLQAGAAALARRLAAAGFPVTASIGCVTFDAAPGSLVVALRAADLAMYAAKAAGKCCVLFP